MYSNPLLTAGNGNKTTPPTTIIKQINNKSEGGESVLCIDLNFEQRYINLAMGLLYLRFLQEGSFGAFESFYGRYREALF